MERLTVSHALGALADHPAAYRELFSHGTLSIEIYKPDRVDEQEPHDRDEVYVIASGGGYFVHEGNRQPVEPGEVLFVPAGDEHRFVDFSEDFSTWVVFYGPVGGEAS